MTGPPEVGPERLGELVDGAPPRDAAERALVALMEDVRGSDPGASEELRERVTGAARRAVTGTGGGTAARTGRLGALRRLGSAGSHRRGLMVATPVIAGIIALAVAIPAMTGGGSGGTAVDEGAAEAPAAARGSGGASAAPDSARRLQDEPGSAEAVAPAAAAPTGTDRDRLQRVTAWTRVRVADVDALSRAGTRAMDVVRGLGGFTASSDYGVPSGDRGSNELVFRVPVARTQDALVAFGRLGTVTGQSADIVDVTDRVAAADRRVERQEERLAGLRADLAADPADAGLARAVARAEAALERTRAARAALERSARLATLRLTLTTEGPPAAPEEEGRFVGALTDSWDRLAGAAAWLIGALVLLAPLAALAVIAALGVGRLRARSARRLMGSA